MIAQQQQQKHILSLSFMQIQFSKIPMLSQELKMFA